MEEILSMMIPLTFVVMLVVERVFPGRPLPKVRFWLVKGIVFFVFTGVVNTVMPGWLATLMKGRTPLDLSWLGTVPGAVAGALVSDLVNYWLHRAMHKIPFVWRWSHQMHHSAERMDLAGVSYTHPFETLSVFAITIFATILLGLSPDAAALAGFLGFLTAVIQHANVKSPTWLGYIVMRPEQHGLHHARDVHAYNYASFPIWDIVFRTFRNPKGFPAEYGFYEGASSRMGDMLLGRDVGVAPAALEHGGKTTIAEAA